MYVDENRHILIRYIENLYLHNCLYLFANLIYTIRLDDTAKRNVQRPHAGRVCRRGIHANTRICGAPRFV